MAFPFNVKLGSGENRNYVTTFMFSFFGKLGLWFDSVRIEIMKIVWDLFCIS